MQQHPHVPQQVLGHPAATAARRPGWWARNWGWVVAGGLVTVVVLFGAILLGMQALLAGAMQAMEVYRRPIAAAQDSPWVHAQIGEPISVASLEQARGNVNMQHGAGEADLEIPIYGPRGSATIYAEASRVRGQWEYSRMVVEVDQTGEWANLLR
ncbi:MAG: cytochrome c oxidase assembly factor Coa1 family protein [Planctomycetota bacterium]|jgi:hypothetical protein